MCVYVRVHACVCVQWFEDKFQEVETEEEQLRKLHIVVDSLVNHRKGEPGALATHAAYTSHFLDLALVS